MIITFAGLPLARRPLRHQPTDDLEDSHFSQESVQSVHLAAAQRTKRPQTLHEGRGRSFIITLEKHSAHFIYFIILTNSWMPQFFR